MQQLRPLRPEALMPREKGQDLQLARIGRECGITKDEVMAIYTGALAMPYEGTWDPETQQFEIPPELQGASNAEAIIMTQVKKAANGDSKAATDILDRVMGKPKQAVETVGVTLTFTEYVKQLAEKERLEAYQEPENNAPFIDLLPIPKMISHDPDGPENEQGDRSIEDLLLGL